MEGYSKPISKTTCYDIELWLPKDSLFQSSQRFCRNGFYLTSRRTLSQKDSRFLGYDVYFRARAVGNTTHEWTGLYILPSFIIFKRK